MADAQGNQCLEVFSLSGTCLAELPHMAEASLASVEEALNEQAEAEDQDLATAWRLVHSGPLEPGPIFATRQPLLQLQEHQINGETFLLPCAYTKVEMATQFARCSGCATKEGPSRSFPRRVLFRRVRMPDLKKAEALYNEFIFLWTWRNENFVAVQDMFVAPGSDLGDWYCIFDYMETSMAAVLQGRMSLSSQHVDYFCYNVVRGLSYLHGLGYAHGNVCPGNIWLNANDEVQLSHLCFMHPADTPVAAEPSDAVREFYSAADVEWQQNSPLEVLEARSLGGAPGDIWALGCLVTEMLYRRRLVPGISLEDQKECIARMQQELLTESPAVVVSQLCSRFGRQRDISSADLEERMATALGCLALSPGSRFTAEAVKQASWLKEMADADDRPGSPRKFPWKKFETLGQLRNAQRAWRQHTA